MSCVKKDNSEIKNKMQFQEFLMNYAESLVLINKNKLKNHRYDELKFNVLGKERFQSKNNYCDQNIQNGLKYLSPSSDS